MFIGRVKELAELQRPYLQEGFSLLDLYGAENAGKTTLLEEFCRNKEAIFFTASHSSGRANFAAFSKAVLAHYKDGEHAPFMFWSEAFRYIVEKQEGRKIIVVLDDFNELTDRDPVLLDTLVKCIVEHLQDSNMFLIFSSNYRILTEKYVNMNAQHLSKVPLSSIKLEKFTIPEEIVNRFKQQSNGAKMIKFSADEVILRENEPQTDMFKIIAGRALCYFGYGTDDEYLIGTLKEGHTFGEYSLLTGKPGIYTVVAYTDTLLLRIGQEEFTDFITMNANNSMGIMKNLARVISVLKVNIDMLRGENGG